MKGYINSCTFCAAGFGQEEIPGTIFSDLERKIKESKHRCSELKIIYNNTWKVEQARETLNILKTLWVWKASFFVK